MRGTKVLFGAFIAVFAAITFVISVNSDYATAAINQQINFQGKLTNADGTNVANGSYSIRFRIYTSSSADATNACLPGSNSCKWEDSQSITVTDGVFSYALGSNVSATLPGSVDFAVAGLYLGIKVGADPEMTPRVQFTAAPYAFNSRQLDGVSSTGFVQLGQSASSQTDSSTNSSIFINKTGASGNILQLQKSAADVLTVANNGNITATGTFNTNTITSTSLIFGGASAASIQAAASQALNITGNAASTLSTSVGQLTLQSASGTVSLGTSTGLTANGALSITAPAANALTLDTGTSGAINIGTNANAKTITMGNTTGATAIATLVGAGTNAFSVQGASSAIYMQFDTSANNRLYVGNPTADGTAFLLVLDSKNTVNDPTNGTNGSMYYNSANNRFRCYENSVWVSCTSGADASAKRITIYDDFIKASTTTNTIGTLGWAVVLTGTATNSANNAAVDADHIGIHRCTGSATNPSGCLLNLGNTQSRIWGGERWGAVVRTPSNLTATNLYVGLGDATTGVANSTDAIQLRKISGTANWQGEVLTNGASTTCDTGILGVINNYVQVQAVVNAGATAVDFYLNGATTPSCTVTAALPTGAGRDLGPIFQFRNADTTTGKTAEIDSYWFERVTGNRWQ